MQKAGIFLGFAPWIVFGVIAAPSTLAWAALAALVCSLVLAVPEFRRSRSMSILDGAGLVFFAVLVVLTLVLDRSALLWLEDHAQLLSSVVIAVVAVGSLAVGRPFTEYYAKRTTPRQYWDSPTFKRINRVLTATWGAVFVLHVCCFLLASMGVAPDLFSWVIPAISLVVAVRYSSWYPDHVTGTDDRQHVAHEAGRAVA